MSLKKLFNSWFGKDDSKLDEYYSEDEQKEIKDLRVKVENLEKNIILKNNVEKQQSDYAVALLDEIEALKEQVKIKNKHQTLKTFKQYLDAIVVPSKETYNFRGKGQERTHLSLKDYDPALMKKFVEETIGYDYKRRQTADTMVYYFCTAFHRKYPNNTYYDSDVNNYGVADYWESPNEAVRRFMDRDDSDCDAHGAAMYGAIRWMLEERFPEEAWRLRVFIVGVVTGGGHYILCWVKEGPNDWIPLETTWCKNSIKRAWSENLSIRDQIMYKVWWSFDHITEYSRL